ncbi:MAG: methyltransferase domain-containing protein [Pseudomonadota bacterium]
MALDQPPTPGSAGPSDPGLEGYGRYFASGSYDRRYPAPNPRTLAHVRRLLRDSGPGPIDVLDYGCGSGRYLVPLLVAEPRLRAIAADPCPEAMGRLRLRLQALGVADRVTLVTGTLDAVVPVLAASGSRPCLALALFGVLAHVGPAAERARLLAGLCALLAPAGGQLVLSVPNERRRFRRGERAAGVVDLTYRRRLADGTVVDLGYHLYRAGELADALGAAGFTDVRIAAESLASESLVTRHPLIGRLDGLLARVLPADLGYGLLATARAAAGPGP